MDLQEFERRHDIVIKWAKFRNPISREAFGLDDALAEGTPHIKKLYTETPLNPGTLEAAVNWLDGIIQLFEIEIPENTPQPK